ncbi:formyltetrahydrofolate deformylase [Humisphaera borealis]|uniref:Formyltetrahydrofolate deformylase n=1 Tax=Humisphaera borealis TaxID=2807512 RepID=A0A7M2WR93_9BACT|nr:formyltetrahydrofolate deformylase [Humisphaera borealis]QOV87764.1 formyltetrahydrofolate deformylase [Humisphaera borealis]
MPSSPVLAVVSVLGKDQKGVVAQFATFLAERGVNIEDIEQHVVRGFFLMDMLVDLKDVTVDLSELITGLLELGGKIDMEVRVHLHSQRRRKRVALLASKEPHCLEHLAKQFADGKLHGDVACVLANHPDLEPLANKYGLPFAWHSHGDLDQHFHWLAEQLKKCSADLVVLARYMRILPAQLVKSYRHKIINIHPSLLPYFPGAAPYKQAFESGVRVHGCTAHFVTEQLDEGPVILQDVFHINVGNDTLEDVKLKGLNLEAQVLGRAVQLYLDEELVVVEGKVIFKPGIARFFDRNRRGA